MFEAAEFVTKKSKDEQQVSLLVFALLANSGVRKAIKEILNTSPDDLKIGAPTAILRYLTRLEHNLSEHNYVAELDEIVEAAHGQPDLIRYGIEHLAEQVNATISPTVFDDITGFSHHEHEETMRSACEWKKAFAYLYDEYYRKRINSPEAMEILKKKLTPETLENLKKGYTSYFYDLFTDECMRAFPEKKGRDKNLVFLEHVLSPYLMSSKNGQIMSIEGIDESTKGKFMLGVATSAMLRLKNAVKGVLSADLYACIDNDIHEKITITGDTRMITHKGLLKYVRDEFMKDWEPHRDEQEESNSSFKQIVTKHTSNTYYDSVLATADLVLNHKETAR